MNYDRFRFRVWDGEKFIFNICIDCDGEVFTVDRKGNETFLTDAKILQSTGLKDKNGKLIFEGDIVEYGKTNGKPFYAVVEWEGCMFGLRVYETDDFRYFDSELAETAHLYEVVSNIHEKPELLEAE